MRLIHLLSCKVEHISFLDVFYRLQVPGYEETRSQVLDADLVENEGLIPVTKVYRLNEERKSYDT